MQTFLPYPSFRQSAIALDRQRLGKQRVEVLQILNTLTNPEAKGWRNHPAVRMWEGHEGWLMHYGIAVCDEWILRGYKDTCLGKITAFNHLRDPEPPSWLGNPDLHLSHRSNLLRKLPEHYGLLWPDVPIDLPYVWPVSNVPERTPL